MAGLSKVNLKGNPFLENVPAELDLAPHSELMPNLESIDVGINNPQELLLWMLEQSPGDLRMQQYQSIHEFDW